MLMQAADILSEDSGPKACVVRLSDEIASLVEAVHPGCQIEVVVRRTGERRWSAVAHGVMPAQHALLRIADPDSTVPWFSGFAEGDSYWHAYLMLEAQILERICPEKVERKTVEMAPVRLPRKTLRLE